MEFELIAVYKRKRSCVNKCHVRGFRLVIELVVRLLTLDLFVAGHLEGRRRGISVAAASSARICRTAAILDTVRLRIHGIAAIDDILGLFVRVVCILHSCRSEAST